MAEFFPKHSIINFRVREAPLATQMDQRSVCFFLKMKRLWTTAIHRGLVDIPESDAIAHSTVAQYIRSASFEPKALAWMKGLLIPG
jgi:hypothetical protein